MKLTKDTIKLLCELERIMGEECYNPNSLNGWTMEEGCAFRYPVSYKSFTNIYTKTKFTITDMTKDRVNSIHYEFGSNCLYVGHGLIQILNHLEKKYGINFNELENRRRNRKKSSTTQDNSSEGVKDKKPE